jgi:hypothetical protein
MRNLTYSLAFHPVDRVRLIDLRTSVYRSAGKHDAMGRMEDQFDANALMVGVYLDGEPIACARVLCLPQDSEWEHDRFLSWPPTLPPRGECAEVSRFCIVRRHRNWRTMRCLCHGVAEAMLLTRQRYLVACCTDELVSFYRTFFSAQFVGCSFIHADLGPKEHHLFYSPYQEGMLGKGMGFVRWLSLWPSPALRGLLRGQLGVGWHPVKKLVWGCWLSIAALVSSGSALAAGKRGARRGA